MFPTVLLVLQAAFAGQPAIEPQRLIQTQPGIQKWMSEEQITQLAQKSHDNGHCGGFMDVTDHQDTLSMAELRPFFSFVGSKPSFPKQVNPLVNQVSPAAMENSVKHLSAYQNRYYKSQTGVQSAEWIKQQFLLASKTRSDIQVESVTHSFSQPSIIARIIGKDPVLSKEIVVLGGHQDSINWSGYLPGSADRAPGADDNASGIATLLEAYRVLTSSGFRPLRTIEFMAYAGEERGLLGSQDIAKRYQREGRKVVAAFQLDMTMFPGTARKMTFISDNTNVDLNHFTEALVDTYVHAPWTEGNCGYACSDHASWTSAGYPSVFPFEALMDDHNQRIHTDRDTIEILDMLYGANYAKLAIAYAVELSLMK